MLDFTFQWVEYTIPTCSLESKITINKIEDVWN
jgi:hypothetical protein